MPNHCYAQISVEEKYQEKLEEISKVGLCRYYRPMPEEIRRTTSPSRLVTESEYANQMTENETKGHKRYPITKEMQRDLLCKYGHENWYNWSAENWGTKWGCYENLFDNGTYSFTSAWCPVTDSIIELLAKDIPNFTYNYEEEQGWGSNIEYADGIEISRNDFEEFEDVNADLDFSDSIDNLKDLKL